MGKKNFKKKKRVNQSALNNNNNNCSNGASMFAVTHDQQLYPAPFRDDGRGADVLPLFDLLGRLLGKAVREGIVLGIICTQYMQIRL